MAVLKPKRGEVWWVHLDPTKGSEVQKTRPAIVVSNNSSNRYLDRVQVVPLTSNSKNVYPSECLVSVKGHVCKAMADQIRTISCVRLGKKVTMLSREDLVLVNQTLKLQLDLL